MKTIIKENFIVLFFLVIIAFIITRWALSFTITTLEDERMMRAHQVLYSLKSYFPNYMDWLKDLGKNRIFNFALGYLLPTPLMLFFGDLIGFKLAHIIVSLITVYFIYLILREHYHYRLVTAISALMLLLTSYGFLFIGTMAILDQFAFMFFFLFFYLWFKNKYSLAILAFFASLLAKDPRIILGVVPGLIFYFYYSKRQKNLSTKDWLVGLLALIIYLFIDRYSQGPIKYSFIEGFPLRLNQFFSRENFTNLISDFKPSLIIFHFIKVFFGAPILAAAGVMGMMTFLKQKKSEIANFTFITFISLTVIYLSVIEGSLHYVYFVFLYFSIFSAEYLNKNTFRNNILFILLSVIFLLLSLRVPIYPFNNFRFKLSEIEQLRIKLLPYSNEGFILSHSFDWGRYFHSRRFGNIWDWEWRGSVSEIRSFPPEVANDIQLAMIHKNNYNAFYTWDKAKNFKLIDFFYDWLIFIPIDKQK